jgi:hypothetical protein
MTYQLEQYVGALKEGVVAQAKAVRVAGPLDYGTLLPIGTYARLTGLDWVDFGLLRSVVKIEGHEGGNPAFGFDGRMSYEIYSDGEGDYAAVPE